MTLQTPSTAFEGSRRIATGELQDVVLKVKRVVDRGPRATVLIFDDATGEVIDVDTRGTAKEILRRLADRTCPAIAEVVEIGTPRRPGRPKLGVVPREVTLLPRHWDWLNSQPGGASVALRKLVEDARRVSAATDLRRRAQEAAYRFLSAMAGDEPGFEEATRALFAARKDQFDELVDQWPIDVRDHARKLAAPAFP